MDNRSLLDDEPSSAPALTPLVVHGAFIHLINYYYEHGFGNLAENPNLRAREENINIFFPAAVMENVETLIPHTASAARLHEISDVNSSVSQSNLRICIAEIGNTINTLIQPTDSCGESANHTARIFLGVEGSQLVPNRENMPSFSKFDGENNTMLGEAMSFGSPVLMRIEVTRLVNDIETTTHSYCIFVAEEKDQLGVSVYQAYFGQYALGEWINDPKFKAQPINFEHYIKQLENLTSDDALARKNTYGELYRLTGSENEVPDKPKLNVYYKMLRVDLNLAMSNIHGYMEIAKELEREITQLNRGDSITPMEHMRNICWNSLNSYPLERILVIRNVVEAYQAEIQRNLDRFSQLSQSGASAAASSSRPDEWRRFNERHQHLMEFHTPLGPTAAPVSSPAIENERREEDESASASRRPGRT